MWLVTGVAGLSYAQAAVFFCRHRQTVWGAVRRVRQVMEESERVRGQLQGLAAEVREERP